MSISNCGHDERGKYIGGQAGDQTGTEWHIINWYNYPWKCILRHPNTEVRNLIADMARQSALNGNIGYDQGERLTYWEQLKKVNYKPENITVKCEADCSSGVASICKGVGYRLNIDKLKNISASNTTYVMRNNFKSAGFEVLTDSKYLTSDAYLLAGDILLNDAHHTAINLTKGNKVTMPIQNATAPKPTTSSFKSFVGYVKVNTSLNVRKGAGTQYSILGSLKNGTSVKVVGESGSWYKINYNSGYGYVSKTYITTTNSYHTSTFKPYVVKVTAKSGLNIRKNTTTLSSKLGVLAYGSKVIISKVSGKWGYVEKYKGWIYLSYTSKV